MSDQPVSFMCEPVRECLAADVAKTPEQSKLKNTLVLPRRLRVRLLDCRSGEPLKGQPVQEVRLNGKTLASFLHIDQDWDIAEHLPIWTVGQQRKFGLAKVSLNKACQIALEALSYQPGAPGDTFGDQGKTAFLKFRLVAEAVSLKQEDLAKLNLFDADTPKLAEEFRPARGRATLRLGKDDQGKWIDLKDVDGKQVEFRGPTDAESAEIVRVYNTKCYRAAQFHLASLGFFPAADPGLADGSLDAPDSGKWTEDWVKAFVAWKNTVEEKPTPEKWIVRKTEGQALMEPKRGYVTDDLGDLHIPIPYSLLTKLENLEVGFWNFAVVGEATLKEYKGSGEKLHRPVMRNLDDMGKPGPPLPQPGPTRFSVEWVPCTQENKWAKPWGWRCGTEASESEPARKKFKEFKTSWNFDLTSFTQAELDDPKKGPNWSVLHRRNQLFSMFYESADKLPEFVLFALVWCQPVWDEFKDPLPRGNEPSVNKNAYIWAGTPAEFTSVHMHVVTQFYDLAGKDPYGGMGYGLCEFANLPGQTTRWRGGHGHPGGIDLHNPVGAECFAVHAGKLAYNSNSSGFGHLAYITWDGAPGAQNSVYYGHVRELVGAAGRRVKAGEVIAKGGRKGWLFPTSDQAGHVHLLVNGIAQSENAPNLLDTPDPANRPCIPFNRLDGAHWVTSGTPLLLPCKCEVVHGSATLAACEFGDGTVKYKHSEAAATGASFSISQYCWAAGCLACPYMPRPNPGDLAQLRAPAASKVKRRVQAQLRHLMNQGQLAPAGFAAAVLQSPDALKLNGDLGAYPTEVKVKPATAHLRAQPSTSGDDLGTFPKGTALKLLGSQGGWYKVELPAAARTATSGDTGWLAAIVAENVAPADPTRRALLQFKKDNDLFPEDATLAQGYEFDQPALDKLNQLAPLVSIE